jgi:hypothetical protein
LATNDRKKRKGYSSAVDFFIAGMLLVTLMLSLYSCSYFGMTSNRTTEQITTQLSERYGKAFTVSALGDRIGKNTTTAYVFADDDPTMMFTVRSSQEGGEIEFENYAYRKLCREIENVISRIFSEYGFKVSCYATLFGTSIHDVTQADIGMQDRC